MAISEFGPRNLVYHEGSRYEVNRVILPVAESGQADQDTVLTRSAKICAACGYLHPLSTGAGPDLCQSCGMMLPAAMRHLLRLQNVVTRRRDRINSDEEERQRQGYEVRSAVRFSADRPQLATANPSALRGPDGQGAFGGQPLGPAGDGGAPVATLSYGHSATLWRINLGWSRRGPDADVGFMLDTERGYWHSRPDAAGEDAGDPAGGRWRRVVPFVEDTRNCLIMELAGLPSDERERAGIMASLQAALRTAIQVTFQLEEGELVAEPLPDSDDRRRLLFFESAEGGAGVLRRMVEDPGALSQVALAAIDLCHVDPATGLERSTTDADACEAACYYCLFSYRNQRDHPLLDRHRVLEYLWALAGATVATGGAGLDRATQIEQLGRFAASELERRWLDLVGSGGYRLPAVAQHRLEGIMVEADFAYPETYCAIFVDGPPHDYQESRRRDEEVDRLVRGLGWEPVRFRHDEDWETKLSTRADIFGEPAAGAAQARSKGRGEHR